MTFVIKIIVSSLLSKLVWDVWDALKARRRRTKSTDWKERPVGPASGQYVVGALNDG